MTSTLRRLTDGELEMIATNLSRRPMSAEFAMNRYPQDTPALLSEVFALRRERAEIIRALHTLPLEDVTLEDGPIEIVRKAQDFWLAFQRNLWGEKEVARLKKAADRSEHAVEASKQREERLGERIAGLEAAYAGEQELAANLTGQVRELTNNLAAATQRESQHSLRVSILEQERAELERRHAAEMHVVRSAQDASERECSDRATATAALLHQAINALQHGAAEQGG